MQSVEKTIVIGINEIVKREVGNDENLFESAIDSIGLVELINLIENTAKDQKLKINLDAVISEEPLTVRVILKYFEKAQIKKNENYRKQ